MSRICPLFSGSTGNSTYIGTKYGGFLIDAGASAKGISAALERVGANLDEIKVVAVTHTHDDHIKGIRAVLNKTGACLLATSETAEQLSEKDLIPTKTQIIICDNSVNIGDTEIKSFPTSHDSLGSCGYTIILPDGKKFSLCTDTGIITDEIASQIAGSDAILLESNHDIEMLKKGPYPPFLKVRIMSDRGHISNTACAEQVQKLFGNGTTRFILGHLSLNNNTPLLAQSTSESVLMDIGAKNNKDYILTVAKPKGNGVTVI
ncbi:MAG: MBL fold metallo-hydrolase [Clostridia bacterium]|nr:MBL fold metallo-hydrolase [Clostridia bacterium]